MSVWLRSAVPSVVLFDRDGTLICDDATLRSPADVRCVEGAAPALARLRASHIALGVVTNQPRVGLGTLTRSELDALHAEIDRRLGRFDVWAVCPHVAAAGCTCRKPMPGLVHEAAHRLGQAPEACVVVGDIGSDVEAATRAGARAILVPTPLTRAEEIARAPVVAADLTVAVDIILGRIV